MPPMSSAQPVLIDFSEAGLDLDRPEMEELLSRVADEIQPGDLVEEARLT